MADWWKNKAWPWLKSNWWTLLLMPLALIVLGGMLAAKLLNRGPAVIDPLRNADERAMEEAETRARLLETEKLRLVARIDELTAENRSMQEHFERRLAEEAEGLRNDPERLRQLMLRAGPGRKP
jgi:hypothetical protein